MVSLKLMSVLATNLALLHAGGWDEILFVAVGLVAAWAIIAWTGRSRDDSDEEDDDEELDDATVAKENSEDSERETLNRPVERRENE